MSTEEDLEFEPHDGWTWLDDVPAWGISLLIHGALGLALMSISWVIVSETRVELTSEVTAETDPVLAEWFLRRFSLLDSLYMVPPPRIVGRAIAHNLRLWLGERRRATRERGPVTAPRSP